MPQNLKLNAGTLARNCYPSTPQELYNEMFDLGSALMGDITGILIQDAVPDPEDRDKAWIRTLAGEPIYGISPAIYFGGRWIIRHPTPANANERRLWVGTEIDLETYDGGSAGTVGPASGPMWEIDHDFDDRIPIGPDTIAAAAGTNAGAADATLTTANLPAHTHDIGVPVSTLPDAASEAGVLGLGDNIDYNDTSTTTKVGRTRSTGSATPVPIIPPVRGAWIIKRTGRQFIVVA